MLVKPQQKIAEPQFRTKAEMLSYLIEGGVPIDSWDAVSEKSPEELFEEVSSKEVHLHKMPAKYDRPAYVARCALTIAVRIIALLDKAKLLETKRVLRSGNVIEKTREWTITGTRRRGELWTTDAVRELKEELGLEADPNDLKYFKQEHPKPYPSSAYPLLMTHSQIMLVNYELDRLPWSEEEKTVEDGFKRLTLRRFPLELDDFATFGPD